MEQWKRRNNPMNNTLTYIYMLGTKYRVDRWVDERTMREQVDETETPG